MAKKAKTKAKVKKRTKSVTKTAKKAAKKAGKKAAAKRTAKKRAVKKAAAKKVVPKKAAPKASAKTVAPKTPSSKPLVPSSKKRSTKTLFTIGYEQTPSASLLNELKRAGVKLLVDVRAVASSRRPGFSKNQLAAGLDKRGISYVHLRGLGTPREGRLAARAGKADQLERIYSTHLKTRQARDEMGELIAMMDRMGPICILCYERDHRQCHRKFIAEVVEDRTGAKIDNLQAALGPIEAMKPRLSFRKAR